MISKSKKIKSKTLLIGWDAADWMSIEPLLNQGRLPHLAKLISNGISGPLKTLEPKLSPLLWTTIATGKTANNHGILNFVEPKPDGDGLQISQSTSRTTKALWNILSQNNLDSIVVGWYASHPAEKIRGSVLSNLFHEECKDPQSTSALIPGTFHPAEEAESISALRIFPDQFPEETLRRLLPRYKEVGWGDERISGLKKKMSYAESLGAASKYLMKSKNWNACFLFLDAIDTMGHQFMQYREPKMEHVSDSEVRWFSEVMDQVYIWHDQLLGELIEIAGTETNIILVSDHGFHNGSLRPKLANLPPERRMELESSWHRPYGILVAAGPDIKKGVKPGPASLLDICPTVLQLMGIPPGMDMSGRVLNEILITNETLNRIGSWDPIAGDDGVHPSSMRYNPIDTGASILQLIDLGYLAGIPESTKEQVDLVLRESNFNLAVTLMHLQQENQAIALLQRLYNEKPENSRYLSCLVNCQIETGDLEEAIRVTEDHLVKHPEATELEWLLCNCYLKNSQTGEAKKLLLKLLKESAENHENLAALTQLLYDAGEYKTAALTAERIKKSHKNDPVFLIQFAKTSLALGQFEQAAELSLDALDVTQAMPEAHYILGLSLAWLRDIGNAEMSLKNTIQLHPKHKSAHQLLSIIYQKNNLYEKATFHSEISKSIHQGKLSTGKDSHPYHLLHYIRETSYSS